MGNIVRHGPDSDVGNKLQMRVHNYRETDETVRENLLRWIYISHDSSSSSIIKYTSLAPLMVCGYTKGFQTALYIPFVRVYKYNNVH